MDPVTERVLRVLAAECLEAGTEQEPIHPGALRFVGRVLDACLPIPSDRPWVLPMSRPSVPEAPAIPRPMRPVTITTGDALGGYRVPT